jgi:taurine---2-oxoglutarate transaminase
MTGLTHTAHPISLAAALGNLEAFREESLVERSWRLGEKLANWLRQLKSRCDRVGDIRSAGLYGCIEFKEGIDVVRLKKAAFERGVHLLARGRCLFLAPPLVIGERDLEHGMDVVAKVLGNEGG